MTPLIAHARRPLRAVSCAALLGTSVAGITAPALAQDSRYERVYERANELRRRRHDERALAILQAHFGATREVRALASMGLAEMALQRWGDAEGHLVEALAMPPSEWVRTNRAALEGALQQCRAQLGVGALLVETDAPGAEVFINGSRVGGVATPLRVSAGALAFEVRAPGRLASPRSVTIAPGATWTERVTLELEARPGVETAAPSPVAAPTPPTIMVTVTPTPVVVQGSPNATPPSVDRSGATLRALGWAGAAGAAVFLGIGAGSYVAGSDAAERWNSDACLTGNRTRGENCASDSSAANTMGAISAASFVTGGALAIASAVLFLVAPSSRSDSRTAWRCGGGLGPSATCAWEF